MKQQTYARLVEGAAHEVFTPPEGHALADCFHADVAAQFVEVPAGTVAGATFDGKRWSNPPPAAPAPSPAPAYATLPALSFYGAFTPAERVAIKASGDEQVREFWEGVQHALAAQAQVDPNLPSVRDALARMQFVGVIAGDGRVGQIMAGVQQ